MGTGMSPEPMSEPRMTVAIETTIPSSEYHTAVFVPRLICSPACWTSGSLLNSLGQRGRVVAQGLDPLVDLRLDLLGDIFLDAQLLEVLDELRVAEIPVVSLRQLFHDPGVRRAPGLAVLGGHAGRPGRHPHHRAEADADADAEQPEHADEQDAPEDHAVEDGLELRLADGQSAGGPSPEEHRQQERQDRPEGGAGPEVDVATVGGHLQPHRDPQQGQQEIDGDGDHRPCRDRAPAHSAPDGHHVDGTRSNGLCHGGRLLTREVRISTRRA